jgi:hypothetical protein
MRKFICFIFVLFFFTSNHTLANQLDATSLPGAKKLSLDKQYWYTMSCNFADNGSNAAGRFGDGYSASDYLLWTNKNQIFTKNKPKLPSAKQAAHFIILSDKPSTRLTSNTSVATMITSPSSTWTEVFLLSKKSDAVEAALPCPQSELLLGKRMFHATSFLATDTDGALAPFTSAFLTLATTVKSTLDNFSVAELAASTTAADGKKDTLSQATAIVDAYTAFNTTLKKKKIKYKALDLKEGTNVISTGFSVVTIEIQAIRSFLKADGIPFRHKARNILKNATNGHVAEGGFDAATKLSPKGYASSPSSLELVRIGCNDIDLRLSDYGIVSPTDRAFLMAHFIAQKRMSEVARVACFDEVELVDEMMDAKFQGWVANRTNGAGRRGVFYASDVTKYEEVMNVIRATSNLN